MTEPRFSIRNRVSLALHVWPEDLRSADHPGAHGSRELTRARAAVCWAIRARLGLSYEAIGEVVGLHHSSVRKATLRAPKLFTEAELEEFRGGPSRATEAA